ncbi:glycosyltransferase family 2 protein [Dokdonia sinensis]|uniref:Glycosyltransferase family 2 protein n=1 Tax=Dokdonia sinensis TaxID=2479847 RepID=A0A3M0G6M2_9FLAO|nr:glycosyltransferase family 2 protein [Dokdonia sinensis]RMB57962.1 glycosyltransferase family 2 protein [Dokdonia sinensis]
MKKPIDSSLVSIITPLYNGAQFIAQTVASIQAQTYQNWEQLIVDDFSTDDSLAIVKNLAQSDKRIKVISLSQNKGAAHARNEATAVAQGKYVAFLDADDLWHPEKLERQIAFMQQHDCAVSYTNYLHIDEDGSMLNKRIKAMPRLSYKKQHANNYIGNLTGIYDVEKVGKIDAPNIRKRQDWAVWLEAIKKAGKPALGLQEDLACYRIREGSMSANKMNLVKYNHQFYREYLGYSAVKSSFFLLLFFWEYFVVRPKWIEKF